ncbi:wall-associated receptor kinase 3-like [Dioscorea cayenensis subsp. rotundata]|uniref:Wall-associated receptor kinase 3-like n=1 Tax=Dioscorea cayennensis subsp. rotundata TaxID=55577 RepID=A0AB40BA26_DIOCR|nr:wall-associated receptor kinase 3-like [Dioscorea cayenensis subsp. rotundata]
MFGYANVSTFNNCSYAFVVERGGYVFDQHHLSMMDFPRRVSISMRLNWVIPGDFSFTLCGDNSYSLPLFHGYLCNCSHGYSGNPYLNGSHGCQDIDECQHPQTNPCVSSARCRNRVPGYKCECPFGSRGDGTRAGSGCKKIFQIVEAILGTGMGIGAILICGLWFYFVLRNRALIKLKEQYFRQNGGLLLKQQVSNREAGADCARIFSNEELEKATHKYDECRILGTGGYGTVYKGVLEDGTVVAIKKSRVMDRMQIDQFINEVVILTQINHRNVVKLLGCCLETEVPLLVYEFIPNGTLYSHLHEKSPSSLRITWSDRLHIAIETAEALAYLHSAASMPVFHRDVKSSNILLGDNLTAKVSDFGISRLVPLDQTQVPTLVQGTFGYLDPEYFQTSQLTSKSDVYSFGVVLVELLTGHKPVSTERSREDSNLAMYFLSSLKCKDLREFIDRDVMREDNLEQLKSVAELARKCLLLRGDKRPSMKEVAQELVLIASFGRCHHDGGDHEVEEQEEFDHLLTFDKSLSSSLSSSSILGPQESLPHALSVTLDLAR